MTKYSIERYMNVQMAYNASLLDNDTFVFLSNITGVPEVWMSKIDPDGKILWPEQLTFAQERVVSVSANPSPDDLRIIYARDVGGNENMQFIMLDTVTGQETLLTEGHMNAMHLWGNWSEDGKQFAFSANRRNKGLFDVYVQDVDGEAQLVYQNNTPGYLGVSHFSPDKKRLIIMHMMGSFDMELLELEIESGEARVISLAKEDVRYFEPQYLGDCEHLLLRTDKDSDFLYVAKMDLETGEIEPLIQHDWDVDGIKLSHDQSKLAYSVNNDGNSEIYLYDLKTGETQQAPQPDSPGVAGGLSFTWDNSKIIFTATRATRTYDIYVWDLAENTVLPLTQSSHAGIPADTFVVPDLIHYPTFDEDESGETRKIPSWVYRPENKSEQALPVVVVVHGGPEGQATPYFSGLTQYLANNGYAVLVPNVRGSTGYGKAYSHLDDVRKRMDSVADLAHIVDWIKTQPDLDAERVAVYGGSYGGFMVLSALTTYPDLWKAGVDIVGISSFVTFLENTSDYRRSHRESEYGSLEHDREFLDSISPINHVDNITAPLFIIHGANDPRVPLSEAEQLAEILESHDIPVELLVFEDEGHGLAKLHNKLVAYPRVVEFLNNYV